MATLQEILADAQYADTLEVNFGDKGKATLGEMRELRKAVDAEKRVMELKRKEAEKLADDAGTLLAALNEAKGKQPVVAAATAAGYDWRTDPLYAPVVEELKSVMAAANAAKAAAEAQAQQLSQISSVYAYERMRGEYDRAGYKDKSFEDLAQEAIKAKQFDRFGLPTLGPTLERLGEPTRLKAAADEAVKTARAQWEAEQHAAAAAPGRGAVSRIETRRAETVAPPNKRIEDLTGDMVAQAEANDPAFRAAMRGENVQ